MKKRNVKLTFNNCVTASTEKYDQKVEIPHTAITEHISSDAFQKAKNLSIDSSGTSTKIYARTKKQVTSLVSYNSVDEKILFIEMAKTHGLNLSAFYRLAANEYIRTHKWNK
jgi:post-segregation antitoxin (ccd killing protein)